MLQIGVGIVVARYRARTGLEHIERLRRLNPNIGTQAVDDACAIFTIGDAVDKAIHGQRSNRPVIDLLQVVFLGDSSGLAFCLGRYRVALARTIWGSYGVRACTGVFKGDENVALGIGLLCQAYRRNRGNKQCDKKFNQAT